MRDYLLKHREYILPYSGPVRLGEDCYIGQDDAVRSCPTNRHGDGWIVRIIDDRFCEVIMKSSVLYPLAAAPGPDGFVEPAIYSTIVTWVSDDNAFSLACTCDRCGFEITFLVGKHYDNNSSQTNWQLNHRCGTQPAT